MFQYGLGAEHPKWDALQNALILSIFVSLVADALTWFYFGRSTILFSVLSYPISAVPAVLLIAVGYRLVVESHNVALLRAGQPKLIEDCMYSMVRHPMYLGILLLLFGVILLEFSMVAFMFWIILVFACEWAASYEERDLLRMLPDEYREYQRRVPKWIPRRLKPLRAST